MRFLFSYLAILLFVPLMSFAADAPQVTESRNKIIKLTDHGLEPKQLEMKPEDMVLFFLNDSTESLVTVEVDYGKKTMHCSGGNLKAGEDGVIRSVRPFGPKDFATVCFHDPGNYKIKVFGLKNNPKGIESTVLVE